MADRAVAVKTDDARGSRGDPARDAGAKKRAQKQPRREARRWVREAKGILALAFAGFAVVALYAYDPRREPLDQSSPVGPIGAWLGGGFFWAFGYAAYLLPALAALYGIAAFVRPRLATGWPALAGLVLLLVSATGILARASEVVSGIRVDKGGLLGWSVSEALRITVGAIGAWIILLALVPLGVLFVTRIPYSVLSRALAIRVRRMRQPARAMGRAGAPAGLSLAAAAAPGAWPVGDDIDEAALPPPLVVKEPTKLKSTLVDKGLAWQETFDFGKGGPQAFQLPAVGLIAPPPASELKRTREELETNAATLKRKLQDFGVDGHIVQASPGPVITSYEFEPAAGVKVSQVVNLSDDLALAMKVAAVRIIGPIPGRGTVAVEVPNPETATVYLREILVSAEFVEAKSRLPLALGKDTTGNPVVADLTAMPHLLIAGATGSGKSVGLNAMICSILYKATPAEVRFLLIDPKRLELGMYEGIPHLLAPVVTDAKEAAARLRWIVGKMDERYKPLQVKQVRNIEGYNKAVPAEERLPYWVVVVDELADLMMVSAGEVQNSLVRLAQIARAVGIHLIVATQRPSVDVVTGTDQGQLPDAHRLPGGVEGGLAHRARRQRRRAAPRPRRHDLPAAGRIAADARARLLGRRRRGEGDLRVPPQAGHGGVRGGRAAASTTAAVAPTAATADRDHVYWDCGAARHRPARGVDLVPAAPARSRLSEGRALHRHDGAGPHHRPRAGRQAARDPRRPRIPRAEGQVTRPPRNTPP